MNGHSLTVTVQGPAARGYHLAFECADAGCDVAGKFTIRGRDCRDKAHDLFAVLAVGHEESTAGAAPIEGDQRD